MMPADVKTSLPAVTVQPGDTITVTLDDPAAVLVSLTVHGFETTPAPAAPEPDPLLAHLPTNA